MSKPIRVEFAGKTYVWVCEFHKTPLFENGHSKGLGMECWPGMMFDSNESCWHPDSSELMCPKLPEMATSQEEENCNTSWQLVEEPI